MSTIEAVVIGWRAASDARRRARAERRAVAASRAVGFLGRARRPLLTVLGLGSITVAAFLVAIPLGLLVAGVAFFTLEALTNE